MVTNHFYLHRLVWLLIALSKFCLGTVLYWTLILSLYASLSLFQGFSTVFLLTGILLELLLFYVLVITILNFWKINPSRFVYELEKHQPSLKNLLSAYYYPTHPQYGKSLYSETQSLLSGLRLPWLIKPIHFWAPACLVFVCLFLSFPPPHIPVSRLFLAWHDLTDSRRSHPTLTLEALPPFIIRGEPLPVRGTIHPLPLFPVHLEIYSEDKKREISRVQADQLMDMGNDAFSFDIVLPPLSESVQIRAVTANISTDFYFVRLTELPRVEAEHYTYQEPSWNGGAQKNSLIAPTALIEGSVLTQTIVFNKPIVSASLNDLATGIVLEFENQRLSLSGTLDRNLNFLAEITDADGLKLETPSRSVEVLWDTSPTISILSPEARGKIAAGALKLFPLRIKAEDNLYLSDIEGELIATQRFEMTHTHSRRQFTLPVSGMNRYFSTTDVPLRPLHLREGDRLQLRVSVKDNYPGREATFSDWVHLEVPYRFEEMQTREDELKNTLSELDNLKASHDELGQQGQKLKNALKNSPESMKEAASEKLGELLAQREELQKKMQEIQNAVDESLKQERASENPFLDENNIQKLSKIQQMMQELSLREQRDLFQLNQLMQMQDLSPEQMQQMLNQFDREQFSRELDQTLQGLEDIKTQRNLQKNLEKLKTLRQKHQKLSENMASGQNPSSEDLEELDKLRAEVLEDFKELSQKPNLNQDLKEKLEAMMEKIAKADQIQAEARSQMDSQAIKEMIHKNWESSSSLEKELMEYMEEQASQQISISMERLFYFLRETADMSRRIQWVHQNIQQLSGLELKRLVAREMAFLDSATLNLEGQFAEEYRQNLDFQTALLRLAELLRERLYALVRLYESDNSPMDFRDIISAYTATNQIHRILLQVLEQMQDQQKQSQSQQMMEQMQQMKRQQQDLNQMTQRLRETPMERQQRIQMMQQIAIQQEIIRQSIEKMHGKMGQKAELAQKMRELSQEMEALENKLKQEDDLRQEIVSAQEKIETRFDEVMDAVLNQKESEKREGVTAKSSSSNQDGILGSQDSERKQELMRAIQKRDFPMRLLPLLEEYNKRIGTSYF
ncbi:MAG: hypothetical protein H3C47_10350 [Candidatus Cloacimonetes bacterium]|nr:hypothetical protein [Candidatus Cloacimonadota bacterium]